MFDMPFLLLEDPPLIGNIYIRIAVGLHWEWSLFVFVSRARTVSGPQIHLLHMMQD